MKVLIINYHFIKDDHNPSYPEFIGITQSVLKKEIREISKRYQFISFDEYKCLIESGGSAGNFCIVTFDDGMIDCYQYALPVLEDEKVKAAFFICNNAISTQQVLDVHKINLIIDRIGPGRFLNWLEEELKVSYPNIKLDDPVRLGITNIYPYDIEPKRQLKVMLNYMLPLKIKRTLVDIIFKEIGYDEAELNVDIYMKKNHLVELISLGHEIGLHTSQHEMLSRLSDDEQEIELKENFSKIYDELEILPQSISYPYGMPGTYNSTTQRIIKNLGINIGVTMDRELNVDIPLNLLELKRYSCSDLFTHDGVPTNVFNGILSS